MPGYKEERKKCTHCKDNFDDPTGKCNCDECRAAAAVKLGLEPDHFPNNNYWVGCSYCNGSGWEK